MIKKGKIGLVSSGFEVLRENRLKYVNNPLIGYLNINSFRNKIVDLREIVVELSHDYYVFGTMILKHLTKISYQKGRSLQWMLGDWRLYVSKFTKHLMIWIQALWIILSN